VSNLIDITEIATRLKLRREYVRDKLVKTGDFPRPAMSLSQRIRRWRAEDVTAWLEQQERGAAR
jgi:predicted DNA-binding transcriptional regulator AlpA